MLGSDKAEAIRREFPDSGEQWVADFDRLLDDCTRRWQLRLTGKAPAGLAINVIYFCESEQHGQVVLKLGHPHPEQVTERIALQQYNSEHVVSLIDADEATGALLLPRILPGDTFRAGVNARNRSDIRLPLFAHISPSVTADTNLPTYANWLQKATSAFNDTSAAAKSFAEHLRYANQLFAALDSAPVLLHGDLHHENLLKNQQGGWTAIDPKGVIGPRILECGRFMHNFVGDELAGGLEGADAAQIADVLRRRADAMAQVMQVPPEDTLLAGYIDLVLACTWTVNDGADAGKFLKLIRVFRECL